MLAGQSRPAGRELALAILVMSAWPSSGHAFDIRKDTRIDTSITEAGGSDLYRVWAVSSDGDILSRRDDAATTVLDSRWENHGKAGGIAPKTGHGVAATGYEVGGSVYEYVFYVGTDGNLYEGKIVDDGAISWTNFGKPSGETLTGDIAATTFTFWVWRYVIIGGTTFSGKLQRFLHIHNSVSGSWSAAPGTLLWDFLGAHGIAATTSESGTIPSFFATHFVGGARKLGMFRWTGSTWATYDLGAPSGQQACHSPAAAQGSLTPGGTYRLYVFCQHPTSSQNKVYAVWGSSEGDTSLPWFSRTLGDNMGTGKFRVSGTLTKGTGGAANHFDFFAIPTTTNKVWRFTRLSSGFTSGIDLGEPPETDTTHGGSTAVTKWLSTDSRVFLVGSLDNEQYLLERRIEETPNNPWYWRDHGSGDPLRDVIAGGTRAEGMLSEHNGTMAVAMIDRPGGGPTDWPRIHFFWSNDDGDTVTGPTVLSNVVDSVTYNYVSDPTTAVTDDDTAYSVQLGLEMNECTTVQSVASSVVYLVSTTNGTTFTTPLSIRRVVGGVGLNSPSLDHPFIDIERRAGADRIHITWYNNKANTMEYAYYDHGVGLSSIYELSGSPTNGFPDGGPPRITVNDFGEVFIYYSDRTESDSLLSPIRVCELKSDLSGCPAPGAGGPWDCCDAAGGEPGGWHTLPGNSNPAVTPNLWYNANNTIANPATSSITSTSGFSMVVSQTQQGVLFYCYQTLESNGDGSDADAFEEKEVYCTTGSVDEFGQWTWDLTPTRVNAIANDDKDQFNPEVQITKDDDQLGANGTVFVSWYDRANSPTNYSFRPKRALSLNDALTFLGPYDLHSADSDPEYLPRHCKRGAGIRFIGDYSATKASDLHTHPLFVIVPSATTIGTDVRQSFKSLGAWWD